MANCAIRLTCLSTPIPRQRVFAMGSAGINIASGRSRSREVEVPRASRKRVGMSFATALHNISQSIHPKMLTECFAYADRFVAFVALIPCLRSTVKMYPATLAYCFARYRDGV